MEPVLFLLVGVCVGAVAAWIAAGSRFKSAGFARESEIRAATDAQIRGLSSAPEPPRHCRENFASRSNGMSARVPNCGWRLNASSLSGPLH